MIKTNNHKGKIRIGLSNAVVPGNKSTFPPAFQTRSRLHYYSSIFNTVEVNSCFYKIPQLSTYEKWTFDVPEDFQFSLKLSKEITHVKELEGDLDCINKFMTAAIGTGKKKGCILIQFPGKISLDHFNKVERILQELEEQESSFQWRKAVEFRNSSWYTGETSEMLNEYGAAMVLHDIPKARLETVNTGADFIYQRFHGPTGNYRDSYPDSFLKDRAIQMQGWMNEGKDVYAYFNNTAGDAFQNALSLKSIIGENSRD